jgi:hypothetical protein
MFWRRNFVAVLVVFGACVAAASEPNLIAYWKFDEASGTVAYDSAGTNHGTLVGDTAWTTGQIGGALEFDGDGDRVEISDSATILGDATSSFSVTGWAKADTLGSNGGLDQIWGRGGKGNYMRLSDNGGPTINLAHKSGGWYVLDSGVIPVVDTWYHCAITYDDSTNQLRIYVDGDEKNNTTVTSFTTNSSNFEISGTSGDASHSLDGVIDDVRIYDRALSAEEIKQVYESHICYEGSALEFDGEDDYVDVGTDATINNLTTFSVSAWFKTDSVPDPWPAPWRYPHMVCQRDLSSTIWTLILHGDYSGRLTGRIETTGTAAVGRTNFTPDVGQWYHAVMTYDDAGDRTVRVYVDAAEQSYMYQTPGTGTMLSGPSVPIAIGNHIGGGSGRGWDGMVDEVGIWNTVLTQEQIQSQMYASLQGDEPNLVAAWGFDEAEWQVSYDLTGGGNDAFLGSDPCNIDSSDPIWVMPGAPAICTPVIEVAFDIKPGSCPNPFNVKNRGVLPAAILGAEGFDVNTIDIASVFLAGVSPIRSSYEDVSAPVVDGNECDCTEAGPDGYTDLTLKFESQAVVEAIGEVDDNEIVPLTVTGALGDETPIEGVDCVRVFGRYKPFDRADMNKDGVVDMRDFTILADSWMRSTIIED